MKVCTGVSQVQVSETDSNIDENYLKAHGILNSKVNDPSNKLPSNRLEFKEIINRGPCRPVLKLYPRTLQSNSQRSFQKSWYDKFSWLEYSTVTDAAYCFPCRCFAGNEKNKGQIDTAFTVKGFKGWYRGIQCLQTHQTSLVHLNSVTALNNFLSVKSIDEVINESVTQQISKLENERLNNRKIMWRLVEVTVCLAKCGKPFRGHDESSRSFQKGLFKEFVELLSRYDMVLQNHFENGPKNASYISNRIQNDIIYSIHSVLLQELKHNIQQVPIAIIADETSDVGHHEQLSIVIRYFSTALNRPIETFVDLNRMISVTAESIFKSLENVIEQFNLNWNSVIAVCFDGASTMAGNVAGVQAKCKMKNENILYVHCYAHCLNLTLMDAVGASTKNNQQNKMVFDFLGTVQFIYSYIEGSPIRHAIFERIAKENGSKLHTLKSSSQTRWACRSEAVKAIKSNYNVLLEALEEITEKCLISEMRAKGKGILHQMKTFEFIFCLTMMQPILEMILKVSAVLQTENLDLLTAMSIVKSLKSSLSSMRNSPQDEEFHKVFKKAVTMCEENNIIIPKIKNRKVSCKLDDTPLSQHTYQTQNEYIKIEVYFSTLDILVNSMNERFQQETVDIISAVAKLINLEFNIESSNLFQRFFHVVAENLEAEITILKNMKDTPRPRGNSVSTLHEWLDWLSIKGRADIFKQFLQVLRIFVVIPVTSCSCERTFSKLSIIKNKLRSTMSQDRLNSLLFLFVEQKMTANVNIDEVIDQFKVMVPNERRLVL